jgi:NAD(P)H-hydrate repair Nnr-like enzyme with NAD(P)H-hydrate dehydratase domain
MNLEYWHTQPADKPLFPDIIWQKPEQKALAGKLLLLGGSAHGFAAVAQAYSDAQNAGVGECRVVLPDALKKTIDPQAYDCVFVPTNQSGGITKDSLPQLKAAAAWADGLLLIGDAGRNSETAIVYEQLLAAFPDKLTLITRDAVDLLKSAWPTLLQRERTVVIATFAQLQKLFQSVYYPRTMLFSMQLSNLVDALHKFTITYPATVITFHQNQLVVAKAGEVSTTPWEEPMLIWRGSVAAKAAVYAVQFQKQLFEALTTSLVGNVT